MIPTRITLENFLTFAGPVEFDFSGGEPLWIIGGPNGVGKSAIFDAVTLALFGVHRGGKQRMDELIRHGADSFRVTLEFEFVATEYRVTRAFSGSKQVVPKLESRAPGGTWVADRRVTKVSDFTPIIEQRLGLNYDTFTKSVLLKQGEADKLFTASREERAAILKGIIGFEQYEALSERVHETTAKAKGSHEELRRQFDGLKSVETEQIATAEVAAAKASEELRVARSAKDEAVQRVERAKYRVKLDALRLGLERYLSDANERLRHADEIFVGKRRLDELEGVVPHCESLLAARTELAAAEATRGRLEQELTGATRYRDAQAARGREKRLCAAGQKEQAEAAESRNKELVPVITERKKWLGLAKDMQKLAGDLSRYPKDLPEQHDRAKEEEGRAGSELAQAEKDHTQAETCLGVALDDERAFADVEIGATCPHCRQPVSELHAVEFKRQLQGRLALLRSTKSACDEKKRVATESSKAARATVAALGSRVAERNRLEATFNAKKEHLLNEGGSLDVAALTGQIESVEAETRNLTATAAEHRLLQREDETEATRLEKEAGCAEERILAANGELIVAGQQVAKLSGRRDEVGGRIPESWQPFAEALADTTLDPLKSELSELRRSNVTARFEQLAKDSAQRAGWEGQLVTA